MHAAERGELMTYEIACMSCGAPLYSGFDLRAPGDVLKAADFRCKKCGSKLSPTKFQVEVKKIDGSYS
jgi:DNA-directed RNA polymerase subunit RPC12/RpoP